MSEPRRQATGAAARGDGEDAARVAKARRMAWLLAGLALTFYIGFMVWTFIKGPL
jgi:hypothetical protein